MRLINSQLHWGRCKLEDSAPTCGCVLCAGAAAWGAPAGKGAWGPGGACMGVCMVWGCTHSGVLCAQSLSMHACCKVLGVHGPGPCMHWGVLCARSMGVHTPGGPVCTVPACACTHCGGWGAWFWGSLAPGCSMCTVLSVHACSSASHVQSWSLHGLVCLVCMSGGCPCAQPQSVHAAGCLGCMVLGGACTGGVLCAPSCPCMHERGYPVCMVHARTVQTHVHGPGPTCTAPTCACMQLCTVLGGLHAPRVSRVHGPALCMQ